MGVWENIYANFEAVVLTQLNLLPVLFFLCATDFKLSYRDAREFEFVRETNLERFSQRGGCD